MSSPWVQHYRVSWVQYAECLTGTVIPSSLIGQNVSDLVFLRGHNSLWCFMKSFNSELPSHFLSRHNYLNDLPSLDPELYRHLIFLKVCILVSAVSWKSYHVLLETFWICHVLILQPCDRYESILWWNSFSIDCKLSYDLVNDSWKLACQFLFVLNYYERDCWAESQYT